MTVLDENKKATTIIKPEKPSFCMASVPNARSVFGVPKKNSKLTANACREGDKGHRHRRLNDGGLSDSAFSTCLTTDSATLTESKSTKGCVKATTKSVKKSTAKTLATMEPDTEAQSNQSSKLLPHASMSQIMASSIDQDETIALPLPSVTTNPRSSVSFFQWMDHRASHGRQRSPPPLPTNIQVPWKWAPWISLLPSSGSPTTLVRQEKIRLLQWDKDGVLLAVLTTCGNLRSVPCLEIYDWDSVIAADRHGRRARRQKDGRRKSSCLGIAPTMTIPLGSGKSLSPCYLGYLDLQWNPHNPDEIALLHLDGHICIYDLGLVMAWLEDRHRCTTRNEEAFLDGSVSNAAPPHRMIRLDSSTSGFSGQVGKLLFVSPTHLVASLGDQVACYSQRNDDATNHRLFWKWTWPRQQVISSMVSIPAVQSPISPLLCLGSRKGSLALLHWQQIEKTAASFSVKPSPIVLGEWSTTTAASLSGLQFPQAASAMGIVNLMVLNHAITVTEGLEGNNSFVLNKTSNCYKLNSPRMLHLCWHTACGWSLQGRLDIMDLTFDCIHVVHSTPKIVSHNERGEQVVISNSELAWSMPQGFSSVVGSLSPLALVWVRVPAVTWHLPSSSTMDHRVLSVATHSRFCSVREKSPPTLLMFSPSSGQIQSIPLFASSSIQDQHQWTVSAVAVHPLEEWLLVSLSGPAGSNMHGLRIYNARNP